MELEAQGKRARASTSSSILAGDRLSSLPDCLIHHIMSLMKARQVVQTCVLSTRWKHLWRSVPCLDIDLEEFKTAGPNRGIEEEWDKFQDFTDHLLIPNNIFIALLDTFCLNLGALRYGYTDKCRQAARWIRHGIKYSTQEPGIQRQGLTSSSWSLKRLDLSNVYLDESFVKHVSSGCQYLQDLELKDCRCTFHKIRSHSLMRLILKDCSCSGLSAITSPTLKRLVINECSFAVDCLLVVTAPAVASLFLSVANHYMLRAVSLNGMPHIVEASLKSGRQLVDSQLSGRQLVDSQLSGRQLVDSQFKLLDSVSNVTCLNLSGFEAMVLKEEFPKFENLRTLSLYYCDLSDNFQILGHFLQNSPNLKKLTLRYCKFSKDSKKKKGKAKLNKGCLSQLHVRCKNLKHTEIIYKDDDVQKLVGLLLSISGSVPKNSITLTKVD